MTLGSAAGGLTESFHPVGRPMSESMSSAHDQVGPQAGGPSDSEIRAAAEVAGTHRVSEAGDATDASPASASHGRMANRPAMGLWETLYERRTTRKFDATRPVPRELVLELLDAALIAPTSCNLQMWDFVVVDDPDQREQLGRLSLQVLSTPVSIFVAYGKEYSEEGHANVQSAAAAMQNMSLAAHALGMGTFWINQLGPREQVGHILGLPADREVVCALAVGWPETYPTKVPRRRPFEHVVHWNHFGGQPIPSSPYPLDWTMDLIRDYQQARVLNGNRYNKSRPWEMEGMLEAAKRLDSSAEAPSSEANMPRWLDVLPVHGLFTAAMARKHPRYRWSVLELSEDVARFAAKRCLPPAKAEALVWVPGQSVPDFSGAFDRVSVVHRLESLPVEAQLQLLKCLRDMLAPRGVLLLKFVSARSFHGIASWMHARRGGPGGVEYVLAPDPNLGPFEAMMPAAVSRLLKDAGLQVFTEFAEDVVPTVGEVEFRTRNMSAFKRACVRGGVSLGRLLGAIPGARFFARSRTLLLRRG
ncbi:MAG: nitroreductase family protein [Planctomycetota bacterium]|nr:nitroreductase family protein [Planctomycetota bacterium]